MKVVNHVFPPQEQAMAFFGAAEDGPFVMVNLLKFKDRAEYEDGDRGLTGRQAYALYGEEVSKLVEAGDADRPIPIVSFIARQRDLRELVGASVPGAQQLAFADVLQWWEARFDKITLEDRNLAAIIERRLLQVRGPQQRQELKEAFERTAKVRQEVLDILLTHEGDRQMFEQVYPFSPALVQTLVALSGLLQRERTALKLMLQLLVQNKDRLLVGDVIPVGDLFDVIIEGDEPFTPVIKNLFDRAREVWTRKFVPLLEAEHNVADQDVRDGTADQAVIRRYRADAGLLKTLLLSSLAPEVESLRNLTPARLAALNHGTIRSPLPNGEASTVLAKVRGWASHAGEIQISTDAGNPLISMQLSGVDVEGVLENARSIDNFGNRVRTVKDLLFGDIGIDTVTMTVLAPEYGWLWRGTPRRAEVLLHNVRQCSDDNFRPSDGVWRVVIDYPFDEDETCSPSDDRARVDQFRERGESERTIVWIPSFLNDRALGDLARLGILNHVLSGNRLEEYGAHLQPVYHVLHYFQGVFIAVFHIAQHHCFVGEEIGNSRVGAGILGAGHRVGRYKASPVGMTGNELQYFFFGRAYVHDHLAGPHLVH